MSSITKAISCYSAIRYLNIINKNAQNFKNKHLFLFHTSTYLSSKGQEIKMPSLSPTMMEGKIVKWLKKEGDTVSPGDVLCDIETDKAVISMETDEEGILAKIVVPENTATVSVGTLIALMVQVGERWQEVELPTESCSSASPPPLAIDKSRPADPETSWPVGIPIKMPSLSPTMTSGTIVKWYKKEGESISPGNILCDIQTDKAVISLESDEEGILAKILIPEDTKDIKVGTLIALIVGEDQDWKNVAVPSVDYMCSSAHPDKDGQTSSSESPVPAGAAGARAYKISGKSFGPAVRSLLEVYQVDPSKIKATGRNNMLLKGDVLKYIEENKLQKKPPKTISLPSATSKTSKSVSAKSTEVPVPTLKAPQSKDSSPLYKQNFGRRSKEKYTDIELSSMRRVIAKRLTESKQGIPHAYGQVICQADELIQLRKEMNSMGVTASVNDYIIKGTAFALEACPRVNVIRQKDEYKHSPTIDISVAVATPTGLITPIITDVSKKSITDISLNIKELAERARAGKLKPHEFQGGSFTISNLGMFGVKHFTAIINPPQCAILAVGSLIDRFGCDRKTHYDIAFTLSYDPRGLAQDEAAEFLEKLRFVIENPRRLVADNISSRRALSL